MRYFLRLDRFKPVKKVRLFLASLSSVLFFILGLLIGLAIAHLLVGG